MNENEKRYPHLEKVWTSQYDMSRIDEKKPRKTVYCEVRDNNIDYLDDIAISYFGNNITFGEMQSNICATAKAMEEYGVGNGDNLALCLPGMPEMISSFYACSKTGAVGTLISPFLKPDDWAKKMVDANCHLLIVMDKFYPALKDAVKNTLIENVVIVPTFNSSALSFMPSSYKREKHSNEIYWNQFIKDGRYKTVPETVPYRPNKPVAIAYSSGTTSAPKGIKFSEDSLYNTALYYLGMGIDITRGQKFYQIIPPWASTGLSVCINLPLTYGVTVFQDPRFERDVFVKNILKHKPTFTVATTSMYEGLENSKLIKPNTDLSFLKYPFEGGEPLRKAIGHRINNILVTHGCKSELLVGYGQCECGATITSQMHGMKHEDGSVGIPLPNVIVGIFDENNNPLGYNERGEIRVLTTSGMMEYVNNPEATEKYFWHDGNGNKWSCTGDMGYVSESGELFVLGRLSDNTVVSDEKIYNFDVEDVMLEYSVIKNVDVLARDNNGVNELDAHIILEDEYAALVNEGKADINDLFVALGEACEKALGPNGVPKYFTLWQMFPNAKSGKRDTNLMQDVARVSATCISSARVR